MSKPKNKLSSKQLVDRRGKPKLQLKGRIFMQNVTDLVSLAKPGSYTCQIFWKGDPSIENFVIRFTTEDAMKKWATQIESQRRRYREKTRNSDGSRSGGTSVTEFTYMQNQPVLENPYAQSIDEDEEDDAETLVGSGAPSWQAYPNGRDLSQSRNGSNSSLRSRSTTGESSASGFSRAAPPRLPPGSTGGPALSLRTRELQEGARSPGDRMNPDSYFSPMNDSPTSSRASSGSGVYPFPRQAVPQNGYYEDGHSGTRFTAPAMPRPALGHTQTTGPSNGYAPPGRTVLQRPGFSNVGSMHSAQQLPPGPRHRSASSPDIHNAQRGPLRNTTGAPPVPDMPATYQQHPHMIPRSQNNSPNMQSATQARNVNGPPQYQRERSYQQPRPTMEMSPTSYGYEARPEYRSVQHHPNTRAIDPIPSRDVSPSLSPPSSVIPTNPGYGLSSDLAPPTQVKVKVHCPSASQVLTLVVPLNISYQSLKDRIDAKLQRSTTLSLGDRGPKENQVKLKYLDEDDFVSIQSDEDVQTAFETWREQRGGDTGGLGGMGEIELFCQR
nr:rho guanine nucleotide exchange factor scd1 [Quercus suber]